METLPSTDLRKIRGHLGAGGPYTDAEGVDEWIRADETDLRTMLSKSRAELDKAQSIYQSNWRYEAPTPTLTKQMEVVDSILSEQEAQIPSIGWIALDFAQHVQQTRQRLTHICSWIIYILGGLALALGIYAASIGLQPQGNET